MWGIENPFSVFDYVYKRNFAKDFNFMCIINDEKFNTFANRQNLMDLCDKNDALSIADVRIKNPDNPAKLVNAKLITYTI